MSALALPAELGGIAVVILLAVAARLLGRWLIRKGGAIEAARHGPLPGGYMDPADPQADASDAPEADRHDPFDAG